MVGAGKGMKLVLWKLFCRMVVLVLVWEEPSSVALAVVKLAWLAELTSHVDEDCPPAANISSVKLVFALVVVSAAFAVPPPLLPPYTLFGQNG